jgi:adenine-specific DNA-methyltransferase
LDRHVDISRRRLLKVIEGEQSGVSKRNNWHGGGSFVYCELAKANDEFVEKIQKATTTEALQTIWAQMKETGYLNYKIDIATIDANAADFKALSIDDQKRFLIECLDKNLLYVPFSDIDSEEYAISDEDKRLTREFYTKV